MHSFVFKRQPKSFNSGFKSIAAKEIYKENVRASFLKYNAIETLYSEDLYGVVYYFYKINAGTDADNISKFFWDILKGVVFNDDHQVKLRIAGHIDISKGDFNVIDFSNLKGEMTAELIQAMENNDHVVYVECGKLNNSMYKFNLSSDGN